MLSGKDLVEECNRLHKRVTELEAQNREILAKFRQRFQGLQFSSAPALQVSMKVVPSDDLLSIFELSESDLSR